jgi:hypothetical protein
MLPSPTGWAEYSIGTILDYSVEAEAATAAYDHTRDEIHSHHRRGAPLKAHPFFRYFTK